MPFEVILNIAASGGLTGLVYGLAALGLSVIFGVSRVVNFAHGEVMVAGMFGAVLLADGLGADPLVAVPIVGLALFGTGWLMHRGLVRELIGAPEHRQFLALVGVAMVVMNGLLMAFGPDARGVRVPYAFDAYEIGPLLLDKVRVIAGGAAILVAAGLFAFFRLTALGTAVRACADNQLGARVVGLPVERLYALTFGLGCAVAGIAGCLMTLIVDVHPQLAPDYTLAGFTIVIIGGLGSATGALAGGVLIGLAEALAGIVLMPSMKSMVSFAVLILVLVVRPHGLFGRPAR